MMTSERAEEAVLGGLLLVNERYHDVAPLVSADHFTSPLRRRTWEVVRDQILAGQPADPVTMGEKFPDDICYYIELASTTPSAANIKAYAEIVRNNWRRRQGSVIAGNLMAELREGSETAISDAIGKLLSLDAIVTECDFSLREAMRSAFEQVSEAYEHDGALPGITTGLMALDEILGGWHKGDLVLVGARPAMGKTALMVNFAEAAAKAGKQVGIISAEQPAVQLGLRAMSLGSRVGAADLRRGRVDEESWSKLSAAIKTANEWRFRIYDRSAITLDELVGVGRKWKHAHGLDVLFLDYAQRVTVPGFDRITEVSAIARGLKNLARDLNIPVVALAQVKAAVDSREDKRPNQGDLANSDELTREADEILMLYRHGAYDLATAQDEARRGVGIAEILIEKNRHGPTGFAKCAFLPSTMRFADLSPE